MPARADKKTHIILSALEELKDVGSEGLTMRRVATRAGMSLGNLQYHFKDKPALMTGLVHQYFGACATMLDDYRLEPANGPAEAQIRNLIVFFLDHVDHITDMCRVFREIWALSVRDETIQTKLVTYYRTLAEKLSEKLLPFYDRGETAEKVVCLLLPYFEGFSITVDALPLDKDAVCDLLTEICTGFLPSPQ